VERELEVQSPMTELVVDVVGAIGFALGLVVVHEYGHLLAGRMLGVPAPAMCARRTCRLASM